jgi:hypothetical protein
MELQNRFVNAETYKTGAAAVKLVEPPLHHEWTISALPQI